MSFLNVKANMEPFQYKTLEVEGSLTYGDIMMYVNYRECRLPIAKAEELIVYLQKLIELAKYENQ